ncbi:MAG: penicillin-insensitive murein endopeptidase [Vicinamibacterales bacterium]
MRVYGRDPVTGFTAFYHILDSRDTSTSTGGYLWIPTELEYVVKYQGQTNGTACNIQPLVTPLVEIAVHARCALHRGSVTNGTLDGGEPLGPGPGYYHFLGTDPPNTDNWGGCETMIDLIEWVGEEWSATNTTRMGVGDISREGGDDFPPHDSHQNGLDVDVRYMRNDGNEIPLNVAQNPSAYDQSETIELLNIWMLSGMVDRVWVDKAAGINPLDFPGMTVIVDDTGEHANHIHIRLRDPDGADSNNC